jgi:serine/threonine protein kinase
LSLNCAGNETTQLEARWPLQRALADAERVPLLQASVTAAAAQTFELPLTVALKTFALDQVPPAATTWSRARGRAADQLCWLQTAVQSILMETCLLRLVAHPHIVHLLAILDGTSPSLVLEFAPLGDLRAVVRKLSPTLPLTDAVQAAHQVASALAHLHATNLLHRDLALRNVLLFRLDPLLVKLADFGCKRC